MMKIKKNMIVALTITACFIAAMFMAIPIRSQSSAQYDPWLDINDDGKINMDEIVAATTAFGATGTPINKTELLIQVNATYAGLLSEIDGLNSSVLDLQTQIDSLNTTVAVMNATNADLINKINALEANYSVTNLNLAPYAIPFNSTYSDTYGWTTEQYPNWVDMPNMTVTLDLSRASQLIIMFGGELQNLGPSTARENTWICMQAMINNVTALPSEFNSTVIDPTGATGLVYHDHYLRWGTYSYTFYSQTLNAGLYTIKLQWDCTVGKAEARSRDLVVIALPA